MNEPDGTVRCLRCDTPTKYVRTEAFRHGGWGSVLSELLDLEDDNDELDLHLCPHCGHVEFFVSGVGEEYRSNPDDDGSTWQCPQCGSRVPDTFDVCWKCEHLRPSTEDPTD